MFLYCYSSSYLVSIIIVSHQLYVSLSLQFRPFSEFSLFQPSFISNYEDGVIQQASSEQNNIRVGDDGRKTIRSIISECEKRHKHAEEAKKGNTEIEYESCPLGDKLFEQIDKLRWFDVPLAYVYRPHIMVEIISLLMTATQSSNHIQSHPLNTEQRRLLNSSSNEQMVSEETKSDYIRNNQSYEMASLKPTNPDALHRKTIANLNRTDITGIVLIAIACTIAVCVGVGGGGMFAPILILMLGFTTHQSTAIAQALMVGGTLAGLILNWQQVHPTSNRPLIDVLLVLLLGPMQISGANIGVVINRIIPSWLIIAFTVAVLGFTGYKTLIKGVEAYNKVCVNWTDKRKMSGQWSESNICSREEPQSTTSILKDKPIRNICNKELGSKNNQDENANPFIRATLETNQRQLYIMEQTMVPSPSVSLPASPVEKPWFNCYNGYDKTAVAGLSDFVIIESAEHRRKCEKLPTTFSEAMNLRLSCEIMAPITSYELILAKHMQDEHGNRDMNGYSEWIPHDEHGFQLGDILLMTVIQNNKEPQISSIQNGGTIIVRVFKQNNIENNITNYDENIDCQELGQTKTKLLNNILDKKSSQDQSSSSTIRDRPRYTDDGVVGILFTEQQINSILTEFGQTVNQLDRMEQRLAKPNPSYQVTSRIYSDRSRIATPVIRMLSYTPILKSLLTPSENCLSQSSIRAVFTEAMSRYINTCITSNNCMVFRCGWIPETNKEESKLTSITINSIEGESLTEYHRSSYCEGGNVLEHENWELGMKDGKTVRFRVRKINRSVRVIGQFKSSRIEVTSDDPTSACMTLELTTIHPLYNNNWRKRKEDEINREPQLSVFIVTGTQFRLPDPEITLENNEDMGHDEINRMDNDKSTIDQIKEKRTDEHRVIDQRGIDAVIIRKINKQEESRQFGKWGILILVWVINSGLIFMKGGKANPGLVSFCGAVYWFIFLSSIVIPAVASLLVSRYAINLTNTKLRCGVQFIEGELVFTSSCVFFLLVQTFGAGIAAGVVGIGGGMILGPMMLNEGLSPQVATAVNSTLVLFASSAASLNFIINGQADLIWSSFFFSVCFVSSLIGKYLLDSLISKYNLGYLLIFLLLFIIILSMVSMMISGVLDVVAFGFTGFNSPCY